MVKRFSLYTFIVFLISAPVQALATSTSEYIENGNKLWSENKPVEAEQAFRKAIDSDPNNATAYARLGALMLSQNKNKEAVTAYQMAIMNDPENASLFTSISMAYMHMGHLQMAHDMVSRALELDPGMENARNLSRRIEEKIKHMEAGSDKGIQ